MIITKDTALAKIPATGKRQYFKTLSDAVLRVEPNGNKTFVVWFQSKQHVIGKYPPMTLGEAKKAAGTRLEELKNPITRRDEYRNMTISTLAEKFIATHMQRRKDIDAGQKLLAVITAKIGTEKVVGLYPEQINEVVAPYVAKGQHAQATKVLNLARQLMRFANEIHATKDEYILTLAAAGIVPQPTRKRFLTNDEVQAFFAAFDANTRLKKEYSLYLKLLLASGVRSVELRLLPWVNVNFIDKTFTVPKEVIKANKDTANIEDFIVPMTPLMESLFLSMKELTGTKETVLGGMNPKALATTLARFLAKEENDIEPWTPHDLRRSLRTALTNQQTPKDLSERILNHARPILEETYDRSNRLAERRVELEKWNATLETLIK